jgi:hypothetical protein
LNSSDVTSSRNTVGMHLLYAAQTGTEATIRET